MTNLSRGCAGGEVEQLELFGGAVIAELLSANRGLGYLIQLGATNFDTTGIFTALFATGLIVAVVNSTVNMIEGRLLRWRPPPDVRMQAGH